VKDTICCREIDSVRVKGKTRPVRIFELLGEKKDEPDYQNLIKAFSTGLTLYRQGKWDDAILAFQSTLEIKHDDFVSTMYMERCKNLKQHPPAQPWDGVFVMTRK
jgi:adenylate cyclase